MLVEVVVEQGADGVVGRRHGMEVAREVQVNLLHRQHLGIAAARSAALHAEARAEGGLAQGHHGLLADFVQAQRQTYADGRLADTRLCGADGRHKYQSALFDLFLIYKLDGHLRHIPSVGLYLFGGNTEL